MYAQRVNNSMDFNLFLKLQFTALKCVFLTLQQLTVTHRVNLRQNGDRVDIAVFFSILH